MGEISAELRDFKTSVKPQIGKMNSTCNTIISKINEISASLNTTKSRVDSYYNSSNKSMILGIFDEASQIYSQIIASVEGTLRGLISASEGLIGEISELDSINTSIASLRATLNGTSSDTEEGKARRNSLQGQIANFEAEFEEKHAKAKSDLSALKGTDSSISLSSGSFSSGIGETVASFEYGEVIQTSFTTSEGITLQYYVYVPKNIENISNLPVMLYMHGSSTNNGDYSQAISQGLPKMIVDKEINPSGIVVMPFITNFEDKKTQHALRELTDSVVEKYNADKNRISVSGHSYGAMTAYRLVQQNPDYFSCCIPISGSLSQCVDESFKNVKVWSFNSVNEHNGAGPTSINAGDSAVKKINNIGGNAWLTQLKKRHRYTNDETYENEYLSPDNIVENPLEWGFRQVKS